MSQIRKCFTSRFTNGVLLELDFSQLEIYVLAYLSGDEQLKADLLSGEDLHDISATLLYGKGFTQAQRKIAKQLSFQLQYGAGAKSMAEENGIAIQTAKRFIENYYLRYTGVKKYHESLMMEINGLRQPSLMRTKTGKPAGMAAYRSLTGRFYTFIEHDAPDWMGDTTSFSPTQIKNYPVQGFATADIVPMVLGKLNRTLLKWPIEEKVLMVCTVHDSVVFDCESDAVAVRWAKTAKGVMENAPQYLMDVFGIDFDMPLKAGADMGKNWHDMKELKL